MITDHHRRCIILAARLLILCILISAASPQNAATEVVSVSNDLIVSRDFSQIVLTGAEAHTARVFIDPIRNVSPSENAEFRQIAIDLLGGKLQLVLNRENANYLIQIIMQQITNYAIRNQSREPSRGYVLVSMCKYPITDIGQDCENLTYFYFDDYRRKDIFIKVFNIWIDSVVPSQGK